MLIFNIFSCEQFSNQYSADKQTFGALDLNPDLGVETRSETIKVIEISLLI